MLSTLNKSQLEAVKTTEGPIRLVAGAGSGKTNTLTKRYAYLVKELNIPSDRILTVTFTLKASKEMKDRIKKLIPGVATPYISTFHSFCNTFLREEIYKIEYPDSFKIIDPSDQKEILTGIYKELQIKSKDIKKKDVLSFIGAKCKSSRRDVNFIYEEIVENLSLDEIDGLINSESDLETKITLMYLKEQKKSKMLDFDDLLNFTVYILKKYPNILEKWQNQFDYIQVDEFQDVSKRELELVKLLSGSKNNIFVVGDADQTIYGFRGSDSSCFIEFDKLFSNDKQKVKTLFLNTNYRSTPEIVEASNNLISYNKYRIKKELIANKQTGNNVKYDIFPHKYEQARNIVREIKQLKKTYEYSDIAILYRNNQSSKILEEIFNKEQIPYVIVGSIPFFQRKEIKLILSVFSIIEFRDNLSFERLVNEMKVGLGDKKIQKLKRYSKENKCSLYESLLSNINEKDFAKTKAYRVIELISKTEDVFMGNNIEKAIEFIVRFLDLEDKYKDLEEEYRLDNILELRDQMIEVRKHYEEIEEEFSLGKYLNDVTLLTSNDKEEPEDKVFMMTIHASKGLEFPVVFVVDFIDGVIPSNRATSPIALEEERRIAYVAITRAEDLLYIMSSDGLNYDGEFDCPSMFIDEIKSECV